MKVLEVENLIRNYRRSSLKKSEEAEAKVSCKKT